MQYWWSILVGIILLYIIISTILFWKPNILRKQIKYINYTLNQSLNTNKIFHISHRGGSFQTLENTMQSFHNAIKNNSEILELDVHYTKDRKIIVFHDDNLLRLFGIYKRIQQIEFNDLPKQALDEVQLHFSLMKLKTQKNQRLFPLLQQVFEEFPDTLINFQIKTAKIDICIDVYQLIKKYRRQHITIWGHKNVQLSNLLKDLQPNIPRFFTPSTGIKIYIAFYLGFLPFLPIHQDIAQMPLLTKQFQQFIFHKFQQINTLKINCLIKLYKLISFFDRFIYNHLKKRGHHVFFWTLNTLQDFELARKKGATGIITDRPSLLNKYLN